MSNTLKKREYSYYFHCPQLQLSYSKYVCAFYVNPKSVFIARLSQGTSVMHEAPCNFLNLGQAHPSHVLDTSSLTRFFNCIPI